MVKELPEEDDWRKLIQSQDRDTPWGRWGHQYNAYEFSLRYLQESEDVSRANAALIRMPTGTGKTGIMALIANYGLKDKNLLIVVPSTYLTAQVSLALNSGFWGILKKQPRNGPKPAFSFVPTTIRASLGDKEKPVVLICTTKTLADIHSDHRWSSSFELLKSKISCVLVDEGHREPARTWAKAVRDLGKPTLLFSATPYRNDLRMFRIGRGPAYRYSVRFQDSVKAGVIRDIDFRAPGCTFIRSDRKDLTSKRDVKVFVAELQEYYYGQLQKEIPSGVSVPRVIVRCDSVESIKAVHDELVKSEAKRHGAQTALRRVLAVHEELPNDRGKNYMTEVPRPDSEAWDSVFWVHQFKLTEGIDNPDFCVVAYYEPFKNSRSFIQQNGRIIRNPPLDKSARAYVFSDETDGLRSEWEAYCQFEKSPQDIIGAADIVEAIRESQPKWFYSDGKYRTGANFDNDLWIDIRVPMSARIYKRPDDFGPGALASLALSVSELLTEQDLVEVCSLKRAYKGGATSIAVLHWEIVQSGHLEINGFFDIRLVVTLFFMNQLYIFYQGRLNLDTAITKPPLELLEIERLQSLMPPAEATLKQISLINCDLGDSAIRRRALGGRALDSSATSLNDHLHFVSSVLCNDGMRPLYIGFKQSRISERSDQLISLDDFGHWAEEVSGQVSKARVKKNKALHRYAKPVRPPREAVARHLLLDLAEFRGKYGSADGHSDLAFREQFLAAACDIQPNGSFVCQLGSTEFSGKLIYQGGRFRIKSSNLNELFSPKGDSRRKADSFLSDPLIMRIVTEDGLIYSDGRFFSPSRLHGKDRVHDLDFVITIPGLDKITEGEKGDLGRINNRTWQEGSLFHEIDQNKELFGLCGINPDILVCDDLGSEIGDFVAVDETKKKLIILHAKVFEDSGRLSAKAMHEITAQAKKNLGFLDPAEIMLSSRSTKWDRDWNGKIPRIRRKLPIYRNGRQIMDLIQKRLHSTEVQKEVWLVLGNAFSKEQFKEIVQSEKITNYNWIQLIYLVHSCQACVSAIGAQLRILTGPDSA